MKLEIVRAGGLAGVATRTELDGDALDPNAAESFTSRLRDSGLLASSEPREAAPERTAPAPARHPDELLYELTAQEQGRSHTQRYAETQLPEDVRQLIAWVDARPERSEAIEPPAPALPD
jgi:Emfourin